MPLDWLFGSKKKSEPEPQPPTEGNASSDEFVLLDNEQHGASSGGMYPVLPYAVNPQSESPTSATQTPEAVVQNFLSGVPFKLNHSESLDLNSLSSTQVGANVFISYLNESINSGSFSYDFQVEKSVLQEAGCRDLG